MAQLNNYGSCESSFKGSATMFCDKSYWGNLKAKVLVKKGTKWTATDGVVSISETEWDNKMKSSTIFPYIGLYDYDSIGNDNGVNTSTTQVERTTQQGLPKLQWMYANGNCRQQSLYNKKGFAKWDLVLLYDNGMRLAHSFDSSYISGFDGGDFSVQTETIAKGDDLQMSTCTMQLVDADQFNERNVFLTWDELGFSALEKVGFNDVSIKIDAMAAGTDFSFSLTSVCNTGDVILDMDSDSNYAVYVNDAIVPSAFSTLVYNASTSKYDAVLDSALVATDTLYIKLNDGTYDVVEDTYGNMYKGTSNLITVS